MLNTMKKISGAFLIGILSLTSFAGNGAGIIPRPVSVIAGKGLFTINENTVIIANEEEKKDAYIFSGMLKQAYLLNVPVINVNVDEMQGKNAIVISSIT